MGIKVYGNVVSPGVQRVLAILSEKELQYDLVPLDMRTGEHKKEPYLSINPFGKIPSLEDGDVKIFESRAIVRYIDQAYKGKTELTFADPKKNAAVLSWIEAEALHFDAAAAGLAFQVAIAPIFGMTTNEEAAKEQEAKLVPVLDVYEARLAKTKYLAGETFTLADLLHLPALNYLMGTRIKALFDARPHVGAWAEDILARPSWAKVVALTKPQS